MPRTRATAVVLKGNSILLIHRHNNGEEYWVLPGGGVEEGESVESATIRELAEETSIEAELGQKLLEFTDARGDMHVLFSCRYQSGEPKLRADSVEASNTSSAQSYEPEWVEMSRVPSLTMYPKEEKNFLLKFAT